MCNRKANIYYVRKKKKKSAKQQQIIIIFISSIMNITIVVTGSFSLAFGVAQSSHDRFKEIAIFM